MIEFSVRSSRNMTEITHADTIAGLVKGLAVLESFDTERQRLNATQAAQRAGLTRAAARRHLLTLARIGYLETDGSFYWLAPRALRLAGAYLASARIASWREEPIVPPSRHRVGIAGLGRLGMACARALATLGYRVRGWSQRPRPAAGFALESFAGAAGRDAFLAGSAELPFAEFVLDSLAQVELCIAIEAGLRVALSPADLRAYASAGELVRALASMRDA